MRSFLIFPLNDILLNEILKKSVTIENVRNNQTIFIFFRNETVEI